MAEKEQLQSGPSRATAFARYFPVAFLLLMIGGCIGTTAYHRYEVNPSVKVKDFESYLREMRPPRELQILTENGRPILVATGTLSELAWLSIPSGPPQYVFGPDGKLLDWTYDCGEGKGWSPGTLTPLVKRVDVSEAREWLAGQKQETPAP